MTKSELIDHLAKLQPHLVHRDVESAVNAILRQMASSLAKGERIEVRGFGTFSLRLRTERVGRNPRTGEAVSIPAKRVLHFKPGKDLRDRVDGSPPETQAATEESEGQPAKDKNEQERERRTPLASDLRSDTLEGDRGIRGIGSAARGGFE